MSKKINGVRYSYVGTTYDDDFIYDIYENDRGEKKYIIIDTRY